MSLVFWRTVVAVNRVVFGHGNPSMPRIVSSLARAKYLAHRDAVRQGGIEPVLAIDLEHPELLVAVLGYVDPKGTFHEAEPGPVPPSHRAAE